MVVTATGRHLLEIYFQLFSLCNIVSKKYEQTADRMALICKILGLHLQFFAFMILI